MLHKEQAYVFEIAGELGIEPKIIHHSKTTISCEEKLEILKENLQFQDWEIEQIVKALYFHRNNQPYIGIITPEFRKNIKAKEIFPKILGFSKSKSERYWIDPNHVPKGMSWGTCSPFPLVSSVGKEISDLILINHEPIKNKLVDISIGGKNEESYKTSMHLPYMAIYEILRKQFGNKIHLIERDHLKTLL